MSRDYFLYPPNPVWPVQDRRPVVMANEVGAAAGVGVVRTYRDLLHFNKARFDAQLEAWRAANALTVFAYLNTQYGIPESPDAIERWEAARFRWEWTRGV